jgi:non-specific protein-tyrosine kinase
MGPAEERQGTARYLQALLQHWPFIVGSVLLAVVAALLYLATAERRYTADADILVTPVSVDNETFVGMPVIRETGEGRGVITAGRLVERPQVADAARKILNVRATRNELLDSVSVSPQQQSNIVTITTEAASPRQAAAVANAFATALVAERTRVFQRDLRRALRGSAARLAALPEASRDVGEGRALAERLAALRGLTDARDPTLQIASLAVPPEEQSWPRPMLSLAVATLVGLLLGIGIAVALELVNPLVLRDEDVLAEGLSLLGRVPRTSMRGLQAQLHGSGALPNDVKDAYRLVRVNLTAAVEDVTEPVTILVSSSSRGEGKTTTAANLALVFADAGLRVVLVDADLRRAQLARAFAVSNENAGLHELLLGEVSVDDALVPVQPYGDRLRLVTARPDSGHAVDALQSPRIRALVEELRSEADVVIFDSPPIGDYGDALPLAGAVDAVILVARVGRTRREKLAYARLLLTQLRVAPAGAVLVTRRRARIGMERPERLSSTATDRSARAADRLERTRARSSSGSS